MRAAGPILTVVLALLAAGCVTPSGGPLGPASTAAPSDLSGPAIEAKGCVQAGGHSSWDSTGEDENAGERMLPAPWIMADVSGDLDHPKLVSTLVPFPSIGSGRMAGNYHASIVCESYVLDGKAADGPLRLGFVGIKVEPPPFDVPTADGSSIVAEYLSVLWSVNDEALLDRYVDAGIHATKGATILADPEGPFLHTLLDDADHGVYESYIRYREVGEKPAGVVRVWLLPMHPAEDGKYHPIPIDMLDTPARHLTSDGFGTFSHMRTDDHNNDTGLATLPLPGVAGAIQGLAYEGFDRTITIGRDPKVGLDAAYQHL